MRPLSEGQSLVRVSLSISEDDGAGKSTGRPDPVEPDQDKEYRRLLWAFEGYYQASTKLGIGVVLPYAQLHLEDNSTNTSGDSSGFGDVRTYALWSPWEDGEPNDYLCLDNLNLIVGLTLPTASDVLPSAPVGRDGQLGGASLDVRLGATYWGDLSDRWAAFAAFNLLIDTGPDYTGYRSSPSYSWRVGAGYAPIPEAWLYLSLRANWQDNNIDSAGDVPDTGGTFWYATPGIVAKPTADLLIDVWGSFPIYHRVHGAQILPGTTYTIGITYIW